MAIQQEKIETFNQLIMDRINNTNLEDSVALTKAIVDFYCEMNQDEQEYARNESSDIISILLTCNICDIVGLIINFDATFGISNAEFEENQIKKLFLIEELSDLIVILHSFDALDDGKIIVPSYSDKLSKHYNLATVMVENLMGITHNQISDAIAAL